MAEGLKALVGRRMTKNYRFMDQNITIRKLTVAEVMAIQEQSKNIENDPTKGFEVLKTVVRSAVEGGEELDDNDFESLPLDELSNLSAAIMKFSGIGQEPGK